MYIFIKIIIASCSGFSDCLGCFSDSVSCELCKGSDW